MYPNHWFDDIVFSITSESVLEEQGRVVWSTGILDDSGGIFTLSYSVLALKLGTDDTEDMFSFSCDREQSSSLTGSAMEDSLAGMKEGARAS